MKSYVPVIKNFFAYAIGSVALRAVTAIIAFMALRIFTVAEFGVLSLVNSFVGIVPNFFNWGIRQAFGLEYFHLNSPQRRVLLNQAIAIYLLISVPLLIICLFNTTTINHVIFRNQATRFIIIVALVYCFIQFFSELYLQVLRYQMRAVFLTAVQLGAAVLSILVNVLLVFYLRWGILGALCANAVGILAISIWALWQYFRHPSSLTQELLRRNSKLRRAFITSHSINSDSHSAHPGPSSAHPELVEGGCAESNSFGQFRTSVCSLLITGFPFIPNILFTWVLSSGNRWMLGYLTNMDQVGIFSLADMVGQMFNLCVLYPLSGSYVPYMLQQFTQHPERARETDSQNRKIMWIAMAAMTIAISVGTRIAFKLGPVILPARFLPALNYIWFILMGYVFFMGTYFSSCYLLYRKKTWLLLGITIISALVNIVFNLVLIPLFSIWGSVLASLVAYVIFFTLNIQATKRFL